MSALAPSSSTPETKRTGGGDMTVDGGRGQRAKRDVRAMVPSRATDGG